MEAPPVDLQRFGVTESGSVRVDKWLWAARMFKTRSQAAKACTAGHVKMDGDSVKASKTVKVGDRLEAVTPAGVRVLVVVRLAERRGPASVARALYEDHSPPPPPREERAFARRDRGAGRPATRERRRLIRLRGRD
ncbi:MAG: RNA-binding S4 domain-containing protein [Myxococcota bacterium]